MFENIINVILILGIIGLIGFLGWKLYNMQENVKKLETENESLNHIISVRDLTIKSLKQKNGKAEKTDCESDYCNGKLPIEVFDNASIKKKEKAGKPTVSKQINITIKPTITDQNSKKDDVKSDSYKSEKKVPNNSSEKPKQSSESKKNDKIKTNIIESALNRYVDKAIKTGFKPDLSEDSLTSELSDSMYINKNSVCDEQEIYEGEDWKESISKHDEPEQTANEPEQTADENVDEEYEYYYVDEDGNPIEEENVENEVDLKEQKREELQLLTLVEIKEIATKMGIKISVKGKPFNKKELIEKIISLEQ